jgi:hypothetical protein
MADPDADFDALMAEMGSCRRRSTPPTPGTSTPSSSRPWTRCAARRRTPTSPCSPVVRSAGSPCASCCCRSPTCCSSTSPPTTSTPSRCCGSSSTSPPTPARRRRHPRPLLHGQRRRVDPRGRPRPRLPLRGQLLDLPGEEAARLEVQGKKDAKLAKRLAEELEWVRSNAKAARPSPRPAWPATRRWRPRPSAPASSTSRRSRSRRARAWARRSSRSQARARASATASHRRPVVHAAAQRHRRRHRPQRRRQDHALQDHRRARGAGRRRRSRSARPSRSPMSTRPAPASTPTRPVGGRLRRARLHQGRQVEIPSRAYVSQFGFKGPDQQKKAGVLSGGERNRLNLALTLKQGGNLLLLDEPTNDLDVETLGSLENACWSSPAAPSSSATTGGSSTASPRTSSPTRAPTRPGQVVLVRGQLRGLREEQDRAPRRGGRPPHRVTYRKLTRD